MRKKTKYSSLLLVAVMLISLLAACSSKDDSSESSKAPASTSAASPATTPVSSEENAGQASVPKDPYEITLAIPVFGAIPKDVEAVQAEISKIAQAKINATVKILPISIGAWAQQMNLMTAGGEKLDLAFTFGQQYASQAAIGKIVQINEFMDKDGQGIKQAVGTEYLKSAEIEGKIYGVPTLLSYASRSGILMRKDLVEKYKIDVASIKSLDDLDSVFKTIKDNEPSLVPLALGVATPLDNYITYDQLGDRYGILPKYDNGFKIENFYASTEYADLLNRMHTWFKAGYFNKDAATSQIPDSDLVKAGKAFAFFAKLSPSSEADSSRANGKEMVSAYLQDAAYSTTSNVLTGLWTISQNTKNKERAVMFLNLMYSDKDIANLLLWGIEGKHYVKLSDNTIDFLPGIDAKTVGYSNQSWLIGNPFLTYVFKTNDPQTWEKIKKYNAESVKSKALGFAYNTEPVKNEIIALNNVVQQYKLILETGTIDPTNPLQQFIAKLKSAGIDKVIAEKQKQLDAWVAAKK